MRVGLITNRSGENRERVSGIDLLRAAPEVHLLALFAPEHGLRSDVETYLDALVKEVELYSRLPVVGGRPLQFVYFGGGTPSFLSAAQLRGLTERLKPLLSWDRAEEVRQRVANGSCDLAIVLALPMEEQISVSEFALPLQAQNHRVAEICLKSGT